MSDSGAAPCLVHLKSTILYSFVLLQYTVHMGGNIASNEHLMENDLEERRVDDVEG
jgi:hypothetical protein